MQLVSLSNMGHWAYSAKLCLIDIENTTVSLSVGENISRRLLNNLLIYLA